VATCKKRGNTWQYIISRYTDGKYDPIRKGGFRTKREAKIIADEIEDRLNKNNTLHLKPIAFEEYFSNWLDVYKKDSSEATIKRYINTHNSIKQYFKNKTIQDINKRDYQEFINEYGKTRQRSTVKKLNGQIRACVLDAIDEGYIITDFTRNIHLGGLETDTHKEAVLNYDETVMINKYLRVKLNQMIEEYKIIKKDIDLRYLAIYLGLNTGLRFGELIGLTKKDIDFDNQLININKTWGYKSNTSLGFNPTKTKETRIIKIGHKTVDVLKRIYPYIKENEHQLLFYVPTSKYYVINNSGTNKLFKKILKKLEIKKDLTVHSLRHTHASVCLYQKISIQYVSERLGHSNIVTTYKYYSHVISELRTEDEERVIKLFD